MKLSLSKETYGTLGGYNLIWGNIVIYLSQIKRDYNEFNEIVGDLPLDDFAMGSVIYTITHESLHKAIHEIGEKNGDYFAGEEGIIDSMLSHQNVYRITINEE